MSSCRQCQASVVQCTIPVHDAGAPAGPSNTYSFQLMQRRMTLSIASPFLASLNADISPSPRYVLTSHTLLTGTNDGTDYGYT